MNAGDLMTHSEHTAINEQATGAALPWLRARRLNCHHPGRKLLIVPHFAAESTACIIFDRLRGASRPPSSLRASLVVMQGTFGTGGTPEVSGIGLGEATRGQPSVIGVCDRASVIGRL